MDDNKRWVIDDRAVEWMVYGVAAVFAIGIFAAAVAWR
jgi:hypothetical protein